MRYTSMQPSHRHKLWCRDASFVTPDRIRSKGLFLHYRFMRVNTLPLCVRHQGHTRSPGWAKKGPSAADQWLPVFIYCNAVFIYCNLPMELREASRIAWALALSITTSSRLSRLSSDSSFRLPISWARRQYVELSGTILISSGKW